MMVLAVSIRSASYKDAPTFTPVAAKKVLAIPPPTTMLSQISARLNRTSSLVDTFEPPTMASTGASGLSSARDNADNSSANRLPAHTGLPAAAAARITPSVEAWARCAVPNASITNTSHRSAYCCDSDSLFFFSPALKRTFSSKVISPALASTPAVR